MNIAHITINPVFPEDADKALSMMKEHQFEPTDSEYTEESTYAKSFIFSSSSLNLTQRIFDKARMYIYNHSKFNMVEAQIERVKDV